MNELQTLFILVLLLCGVITAATLCHTKNGAILELAGLAILMLGGAITVYSSTAIGMLLGLGTAWLGGAIMQRSSPWSAFTPSYTSLALLALAFGLLSYCTVLQLQGWPISSGAWIAGCSLLMLLGPRLLASLATPLLIRAPMLALGLPVLAAYAFVSYATETYPSWPQQTTNTLLLLGIVGLVIAVVNAVAAQRLGTVFGWQLVAQLAFLLIVFGTDQPAAGPIAAGLLAHIVIATTSLALTIGLLQQATGSEDLASLPLLPHPFKRAGLAYGLAAMSSAGIPPLLGYALKRVVLLLAAPLPWLTPLLLAISTLLALSYLPTLVAFFRHLDTRSLYDNNEQRGGNWPLVLMVSLLAAGLIPDPIWQWILGDPAVAGPQAPPVAALLQTGMVALLVLVACGLGLRALRRMQASRPLSRNELSDAEPELSLQFSALQRTLRLLIVPEHTEG